MWTMFAPVNDNHVILNKKLQWWLQQAGLSPRVSDLTFIYSQLVIKSIWTMLAPIIWWSCQSWQIKMVAEAGRTPSYNQTWHTFHHMNIWTLKIRFNRLFVVDKSTSLPKLEHRGSTQKWQLGPHGSIQLWQCQKRASDPRPIIGQYQYFRVIQIFNW